MREERHKQVAAFKFEIIHDLVGDTMLERGER